MSNNIHVIYSRECYVKIVEGTLTAQSVGEWHWICTDSPCLSLSLSVSLCLSCLSHCPSVRLLGNHLARTIFDVKRPYIRLLWAYFPCFSISAFSRITSSLLCKYFLYFLHRSLVINVNSICGDRFRTFSEVGDAFKRYNFFEESVNTVLFPKYIL